MPRKKNFTKITDWLILNSFKITSIERALGYDTEDGGKGYVFNMSDGFRHHVSQHHIDSDAWTLFGLERLS